MAKKKGQGQRANEELRTVMPPGAKLLRTLEGHQGTISSVAFDPRGEMLASGSYDKTVKLWEVRSGKLLRSLEGHHSAVYSVIFDPQGEMLASGSADKTVKLWEPQSGKLLRTLEGYQGQVYSMAFEPQGRMLAIGSADKTVRLWEVRKGELLRTLELHGNSVRSVAFDRQGVTLASGSLDRMVMFWKPESGELLRMLEGHQDVVYSVAFDPQGRVLASGGNGESVQLWEAQSGKLLRTLEGHTASVDIVAFSPDGRLLASKSRDHTIRLWSCETWETVMVIPEQTNDNYFIPALAFHPTLPLLATAGLEPGRPRLIHLWELDYDVLLGQWSGMAATARAVHHTTGKIVLVGDHSVGKSALGHRLIHGSFKEQASTHGQQFWVFPALGQRRADGTDCEAILWDFAGQPDYRHGPCALRGQRRSGAGVVRCLGPPRPAAWRGFLAQTTPDRTKHLPHTTCGRSG